MSTISDIITEVRVECDDVDKTRWDNDDDLILPLVKRAYRRVENIGIRKGLDFARTKAILTLSSGSTTVALPDDFKRDIGLYIGNEEITKLPLDEFEQTTSGDYWIINGDSIQFISTASEDTSITFWYYPALEISEYTTSTTTPWNGRLDDIVVEYVSLRLKNIDEYNTEMELQFLAEMQDQILEVYQPLTAVIQTMGGWNN